MFTHERFEWDSTKERSNFRKHGVSFHDAAELLMDAYAAVFHMTHPSRSDLDDDEERWVTLASHPYNRSFVLFVVWTYRTDDDAGRVTRIISARPATTREKADYEKEIFHQ